MREKLIVFFKSHPKLILRIWSLARSTMRICQYLVPIQSKTILFSSFGGRKFDDSPKAIYDEICSRKEFDNWRLVWAFVNPNDFTLARGEKVKIDTLSFFKLLLCSHVWVGNSRIDRGIELKSRKHICVETWHGTPLKKICGEENAATFAYKPEDYKGTIDCDTIRCAQSEYDRRIFERIFHASKDSILLCDLPRNDKLLRYKEDEILRIKESLGIPLNKKVILYTPTYREYLVDKGNNTFLAPPITLSKWKDKIGENYVFLIRAHYAVTSALNINDDEFVKDVSNYQTLNDLYIIADLMISDYSSTYFDYAILDRPMLCFAYDEEEYKEKRGLYLELENILPCEIDKNEDTLLNRIQNIDYQSYSERTKQFHKKFAPYAGNASKRVVDEILRKTFQF